MTYAIGDPDHIDVHESIRLLFMAAGLDPALIPGTATIGATGHVDDHNRIADALAWIDENGVLGPDWATVASTTGSPTTGTFTGTDGVLYNYWKWTGAGSVTFATPGRVKGLLVGGGGGAGVDGGGGGGGYLPIDVLIDNALRAWPIVIGAGGTGAALGGNGGYSNFGWFQAVGGGGGASSVAAASIYGASGGGSGRGGIGGPTYDNIGPQGYPGILTGVAYGYNNGGGGAGRAAYGTGAGPGGANSQGGDGALWLDGNYYAGGGCAGAYTPLPAAYHGSTAPGAAGAANTGAGGSTANNNGGSGLFILAIKA